MKRYWRLVVPAAVLAVIVGVLLVTLTSNLVYFNTPTELMVKEAGEDRLRLGGQVADGTVEDTPGGVAFLVTDGRETVPVTHNGAPQQLFQEGIGVVVEGTWDGTVFSSDTMLVKHDEQYRTEEGDVYEIGDDTDVVGDLP